MTKAKWLDKKRQYFKTSCDNLRLREFMRNVFTFSDWKSILKEFLK